MICGVGPIPEKADRRIHRIETGTVDGIGTKPGENAHRRSETDGSQRGFLGYTFRYDRDLHGHWHRYLNMIPSKKALKKEREKLREMTSSRFCFKPLPILIQELNRNLQGWAAYFRVGYPRRAYDNLNSYVQRRLGLHLDRRSQRRYRAPANVSLYEHLRQLGLRYLSLPRRSGKLFT